MTQPRRPGTPQPRRRGTSGASPARPPARPVRMGAPARARLAAVGHPRRRSRGVLLVFALVVAIFAYQLFDTQWFHAGAISRRALDERLTSTSIPAARGTISDSTGAVLARSIERRDVAGDPVAAAEFRKYVKNKGPRGIDGVSALLAQTLGGDASDYAAKFQQAAKRDSRFVYLAKDISPAQWSQLSALELPGISSELRERREYPQRTEMSSLIGWVNAAGVPGGGIEQMLDRYLKGTNGVHQIERARDGRPIATGDNLDQAPVSGRAVDLTIDNDIQWYAQNELTAAVKKTNSQSGEIVVSDKHGHLLAAASYPTFDNNDMASAKTDDLQNRAFTDTFEPGSTQKMVTAGALLEEGLATPLTHIQVPSVLKRAGRPFHDSHPHGTEDLTLAGVIAESSNMGTILAGEKMPKQKLYDYMMKFGLGKRTGIGFPGESAGIVPNVTAWRGDVWYTVMFGQGLASSAVQQTALFQTIANGGERNPLELVSKIQADDGSMKAPEDTRTPVRVFSEKTSKELIGMMQGVVSKKGSAPLAAVDGYDVAGKTSTAQRYDQNEKKYDGVTAGFIGLAPAKDPQLIVSVTLQKPQSGTFGGDIAAPVFSKVMGFALQHRKIPPNKSGSLPYPIEYRPEESTSK